MTSMLDFPQIPRAERLAWRLEAAAGSILSFGRPKVFGIGRNKTGTTSLTRAMAELGYRIGNQRRGEYLVRSWARRDFRKIARYCRAAQFFQDIPFSLPFTFQAMDLYYPGSKFVLTVRDAESWHHSMVKFHRKASVHGDKALSLEALKEATYCYRGYAYDTKVLVYELPGDDPYEKDTLISHYEYHNRMVRDYFRHRPDDLLVLDLSETGAYRKLCDFLGVPRRGDEFPWENKTE